MSNVGFPSLVKPIQPSPSTYPRIKEYTSSGDEKIDKSGKERVNDLFGIHPSSINLFLKYLSVTQNLHLENIFPAHFDIPIFTSDECFRNCLYLFKCSISSLFKLISTLLLVDDTLPSAYKNPNQ